MCNAKKELLETVDASKIIAAFIEYKNEKIILRVNHTAEEFNEFLNKLDFNYDNGFGRQYVFGEVWLKNKEWLERDEYDGAEDWAHKVCPKIPSACF